MNKNKNIMKWHCNYRGEFWDSRWYNHRLIRIRIILIMVNCVWTTVFLAYSLGRKFMLDIHLKKIVQ